MQKIKYLKAYEGHKKGEVDIVRNNKAAVLIQQGIARLVGVRLYTPPVKMMSPRRKKRGYKTK